MVTVLGAAVALGGEVALPFLVIEDSEGDTIGPVVGFATNTVSPIIMLTDEVPEPDVPVFLYVRRDDTLIAGPDTETLFQNDDCTGSAYIATGTNHTEGVVELTGFAYTVAQNGPSGGDQMLYRADMSATPASQSIQSKFRPCCNLCQSASDTTAVPATLVLNLDIEYPPPYQTGTP